jgi:hypothetical protein
MPVVEKRPPVTASPNACVSRSNSPQVRPHGAALDVDPHALHRREVDHEAVVTGAVAVGRVAAAAHRDLHRVHAREVHGLDHVSHACTARDRSGPAVEHAVPDAARLVVPRAVRREYLAAHGLGELRYRGVWNPDARAHSLLPC